MAKELTKKQETFVAEYLTDLNATRAAIAAGYSEKNADKIGSQLLGNPRVSAFIAEKHGKRINRLEITADRVLQEIAKLAFYDPAAFFEDDGSLKRIQDLDENTRMAIAGLEVTELFEGKDEKDGPQQKTVYGLLKKIKLTDKGQNLERLGKHLKLFTDKTEHNHTGAVEIVVRRVGD